MQRTHTRRSHPAGAGQNLRQTLAQPDPNRPNTAEPVDIEWPPTRPTSEGRRRKLADVGLVWPGSGALAALIPTVRPQTRRQSTTRWAHALTGSEPTSTGIGKLWPDVGKVRLGCGQVRGTADNLEPLLCRWPGIDKRMGLGQISHTSSTIARRCRRFLNETSCCSPEQGGIRRPGVGAVWGRRRLPQVPAQAFAADRPKIGSGATPRLLASLRPVAKHVRRRPRFAEHQPNTCRCRWPGTHLRPVPAGGGGASRPHTSNGQPTVRRSDLSERQSVACCIRRNRPNSVELGQELVETAPRAGPRSSHQARPTSHKHQRATFGRHRPKFGRCRDRSGRTLLNSGGRPKARVGKC